MATPAQPTEQQALQAKARRQMMTGAMMVMGGCVFGGLTAVVFMAVGQRTGASAVAIITAIEVAAGIAIQVAGFRNLKAATTAAVTKDATK